jgi:4-amino-4-deoxy-L-arabinose transferase-like glycosyltransferase
MKTVDLLAPNGGKGSGTATAHAVTKIQRDRGLKLNVLDWTIPIVFGVVLVVFAPLRTAMRFGYDEGYELMKALLINLGHPLYREVWNDQPPLHTEIVALLFSMFGPSAFAARLLSIGFAMVLVGAVYKMTTRGSGRIAGLVAVILLLSFPYFLQLSVSVMLELPAASLATASIWALAKYYSKNAERWLLLSGILFGCALQIKLTAVLFLPALLAEYAVMHFNRSSRFVKGGLEIASGARQAAMWIGIVALVFGLISFGFYNSSTLKVFYMSHSSGLTHKGVSNEYVFSIVEFCSHNLLQLIAAMSGLIVMVSGRRWELASPAVLLASMTVVHLTYQPYWHFYTLHFAIPMAWLGAVGVVEFVKCIWRWRPQGTRLLKVLWATGAWVGSSILLLMLVLIPEQIWAEAQRIGTAAKASSNSVVVGLREDSTETHWVFTDCDICAFWAGLPVPPELAVIPLKRIWAGQINPREIVKYLEQYKPEQVVFLSDWEERFQLSDYLRQHYHPDPVSGIYRRN